VKNRVAEIKLPFPVSRNQGEKSTIQEENDEVKELRMKLANLEAEKSALEENLIKLKTSFKDLQYETGAKTHSLENENKRARIDEESMDINQGRFGCRKQGFCFRPLNLT
jgi:predicted nuclease with TOPRIM domain